MRLAMNPLGKYPTSLDNDNKLHEALSIAVEFAAAGRDAEEVRRRVRAIIAVISPRGEDAKDADLAQLENSFRKKLKDCI